MDERSGLMWGARVALVLAVSAALAPWVHAAAHAAATAWGAGDDVVGSLTLSRVFARILLVTTLIVLGPPLWRSGALQAGWAGWRRRAGWQRDAWRGLGCGMACGGLLLASEMGMGARVAAWDLAWGAAVGILVTAALVSAVEETLFRGVLMALFPSDRPWRAVLVTGLVFGLLHFLKPPGFDRDHAVTWDSGFALVGALPAQFVVEPDRAVRLVNLTLLGLLLGVVRVWRGDLWAVGGLHAGLVIVMLVAPAVTDHKKGWWREIAPRDFGSGWDATILLVVALGVSVGLAHRARRGRGAGGVL